MEIPMPVQQKPKTGKASASEIPKSTANPVEYTGRRTKTGNSTGFRFEGALFKSHPEFSGQVRARVIAPGRLLVTAEATEEKGSDPVIATFLAFLAQDMLTNPQSLHPLDQGMSSEIASLVHGVVSSKEEDLGPGSLL